MNRLKRTWPLHVMLLPALVFLVIFSYVPIPWCCCACR
ncbi:ABC-type polysaccharide transport system permease subunit [Paenibacillus sp. OAE614]